MEGNVKMRQGAEVTSHGCNATLAEGDISDDDDVDNAKLKMHLKATEHERR